jgi:hypothetical protein
MRNIIQAVTLALALAVGAAGAVQAAPSGGASKAASVQGPNRKKVLDHLKNHQQYPATRAELLAACENLKDFSDAEKQWFADRLPEGTYASADEVMKAVYKK